MWLAAIEKSMKAKQATGEVIDWSDRLECAARGLGVLEEEVTTFMTKDDDKIETKDHQG